MFLVTNRNLVDNASGFQLLGSKVNPEGPAELRLVEVVRRANQWHVTVLPDIMTREMKEEVGITEPGPVFASQYVFRRLMAIANPRMAQPTSRRKGKDILLFVHGFNNSFADVVERCQGLAEAFDDLEVVAFTWPANGGGARGVTDYRDDKRDAQASVVAFDRVLAKTYDLLAQARGEYLQELQEEAATRFPDSGERQREFVAARAEQQCPFRLSLLLHSMGNYLLERTLKSTALRGQQLIFDNIIMAAADVNSPGHEEWVNSLQVRNRLYVTINEDDYALRASRLKGGDEQLARLGHYPYNLNARQAVYVDFTQAPQVGTSHAYFEGDALKNAKVRKFFDLAVHGQRVDESGILRYDPSRNLHRFA